MKKQNPTNPFNVTIVFVLHTDHICSNSGCTVSEATTVKFKTSYTNSKERMIVRGLDANKQAVWKYVTKKYTATELPKTKCIVRKDKVYIFDNSKIVVLQEKKTAKNYGRQKKSVRQDIFANLTKMANLYVTGYYDQTVYKVSKKGKILWKTNISKTGNYWPYKITVSRNKITVLYECSPDDYSSDKTHKIVFNSKNGKIIKYS